MAEPIVRKFVIDTTESEQNLKELNVQLNATGAAANNASNGLDELPDAENKITASTKSLKAQLKELQAQLANTEPDSEKYRELAAAAGELKDKIQDAAQAVGTQAGGAFERVSGSLGLVTSRIANLDFEGAAEGAKLLAQNITQIKPGDIAKGISSIGSAFGAVGKALLTNPIFLIGAAIAAAIVYADELLSLIDGVTDAETEALNKQKERAALAKEQVDLIGLQEESLKRQGFTEEEILQKKLEALDTAILEQEVVIETNKAQAKAQTEAAQRNAEYLRGFLEFVTLPQRKLAEFFQGFVNGAIKTLNLFGAGIEEVNFTKVFDDVNDYLTKKLFDPAQVQKDGEATIKESEKTLLQLKAQRDGLLNAEDAKNKARNDKAAADAKTAREKELEEERKLNEQILEIRRKTAERSLAIANDIKAKTSKPTERPELVDITETLKAQRDAEELRIGAMAEGIDKEIALVDLKYARMRDAAQGNADQIKIIAQQNADEVAAIEEAAARKRIADEQAVKDAKLQMTSDVLGSINSLVGAFAAKDEKSQRRAFKAQKAISIAQATVDTYKGANAIFASAAANPATVLFPAQPFLAAGAAIAAGIANVATIAKQEFQGGTPPATNETPPPSLTDGGGGSQPAAFNPFASSFLQDRPEQITPRAYVLAGDVASQQEVRTKVEDLSRIG